MAKKLTLIVPDQVYETLKEIATTNEDTLSGVTASSIKALDWILKQKKEGFVVRAERELKDRTVIRELVVS